MKQQKNKKEKFEWLRHVVITVLAFAVVGMFAVFALNLTFLSPIAQVVKDFEMTDIYYQILQDTDSGEVSDVVTIVDMSELYSRRELAEALVEIEAQKPKAVGVDVVFEGLKEDTVGDEMLRQVAKDCRNMVFAYKLLDYDDDSVGYAETVHSFFATDGICEGFTNMKRNLYGGMKRTLSLNARCQGEMVPSFVWQVTEMNGSVCGKNSKEELTINFTPRRFRVVKPDSLCIHPEWIKDRIVLFGAMKEEADMHYTPLGKMAGVELLAYSVETLLEHSEVKELSGWAIGVMSFLLALLTQVVFSTYKAYAKKRKNRLVRFLMSATFVRSILMFLWMAFWIWVAFILFCKYDISLNLGWALSAMAFLVLAESIYDECKTAIKEKRNGKETGDDARAPYGTVCRGNGTDKEKEEVGSTTVETVCPVCQGQSAGQGEKSSEESQRPCNGDPRTERHHSAASDGAGRV